MSKLIQVGKIISYYAIVDDGDFDRLSQFTWSPKQNPGRRTVYAYRALRHVPEGESQYMHKVITGFDQTDHINGIGLDNRRENLREATTSTNHQNILKVRTMGGKTTSSTFKGVYWHKGDKRWIARIHHDNKYTYLGGFKMEVDAALAYNKAAIEKFGAFANLNFLGG